MEQDLRIYAKGGAFTDGVYDLRTLEALVTNYRKILDCLVAVQLGKKQVTPSLKNQLDYDVKINSGSIEMLVNFASDHREYFGAFVADGGQSLFKVMVTLLRNAITLREKASEITKKDLPININISNSFNFGNNINNTSVSSDQNSGTIVINDPKILWAAQMTRTSVNGLLNKIDGDSIEFIELSSSSNKYRLTPDQRNIIGQAKEELPATLNIIGRLDMVAFSSHRGDVISDGARFHVTWDEQIRSKMQQVGDIEGVVFKVRTVIDHKRLDNEAIGFHVLDCRNSQGKLEL